MRCNGDNNDLIVGAVVEENPVRGGSPVFGVCLEDRFAAWSLKCLKLVRSQTRMSRIRLEQTQCLLHGLESFPQSAIPRKCFQIFYSARGEPQRGHRSDLFDLVVNKPCEGADIVEISFSRLGQAFPDFREGHRIPV
jgi:hypothetical protein